MGSEPTHDSARAKAFRKMYPGYGWCMRCGMPWAVVEGHSTRYSSHNSCFPLCKLCWYELEIPDARIPYYEELIDKWNLHKPMSEKEKTDIREAVANGG